MTIDEVKNLTYGQTIYHKVKKNADGTAMRVRLSGKVKVWKRDSSKVHAPIKHGMYESYWIDENNMDMFTLDEPERVKLSRDEIRKINRA
jgi:hypothetical protein